MSELAVQPLPHDLAAEPIIGWRIWNVRETEEVTLSARKVADLIERIERGENPLRSLLRPALYAIAGSYAWLETEAARCAPWYDPAEVRSHEAPDPDCMCGFWALQTEEQMHAVMTLALAELGRSVVLAYGRVQLWGRVIEHDLGYRAQFARPYDITVVQGSDATAAGLRDRYACDVNPGVAPPGVLEGAKRIQEESADALITMLASPTTRASRTSGEPARSPAWRSNRRFRWFWPLWLFLNGGLLLFTGSAVTLVVVLIAAAMTLFHWWPHSEDKS